MKTCDICSTKLGFQKFAYAQGYLCKNCYRLASQNYTETIRQKDFDEIAYLCQNNGFDQEQASSFETTKKIGNYLLLDDKHHKLCILNHRLQSPGGKPEFFSLGDICAVGIHATPKYDITELLHLTSTKEDVTISKLSVTLGLNDNSKEIVFLNKPVRTNSFAFKQVLSFAHETYRMLSERISVQTNGE